MTIIQKRSKTVLMQTVRKYIFRFGTDESRPGNGRPIGRSNDWF